MLKVIRGQSEFADVSLPDFEEEARKVLEDAREKARLILSEASSQAEEIRRRAREEGYAAGLAQGGEIGLEEGRAKALEEARAAFSRRSEQTLNAIRSILERVSSARGVLSASLRAQALETLLSLAEYLARRKMETDPLAVRPVLDDLLSRITSTPAVVKLSPADAAALRELAPEFLECFRPPEWNVSEDPSLEPGDVRIEHPSGTAESSFRQRMEILKELLLNGGDTSAV